MIRNNLTHHSAHLDKISADEPWIVVPGLVNDRLLAFGASSTSLASKLGARSALEQRNVGSVRNDIPILDHHAPRRVYRVVNDNNLALHQLQADVADRTRVIPQHEVHFVAHCSRSERRQRRAEATAEAFLRLVRFDVFGGVEERL